jgi:putative phosphoesterase
MGARRPKEEVIIGVISDTHSLMRPEALDALAGSNMILHAGDIGSPDVLARLASIAPVTAVRGNNDKGFWANDLAEAELVEVDGASIYLLHDLKTLDLEPSAADISVVVSGHSHQPAKELRDGVLYFNPGSAGPRRFRLPIAVGRLTVKGGVIDSKLILLDGGDGGDA